MIEPTGLRSLYSLLQVYGPRYVAIGRLYEQWMSSLPSLAAHPRACPNAEQLQEVLTMFRLLLEHCQATGLTVSATTLVRTIEEFQKEPPMHQMIKDHIAEWFSCFQSELQSQLFFLVLPHRVPYWANEVGACPEAAKLIQSVSGGFPGAQYDAIEACACFAFARFTASAYHLMRVAEYGLVGAAVSIGVPEEKHTGWDKLIQGIEGKIKALTSTKGPNWKAEERKYSDLCSWFTTIKNGWRNPISHIPRIYSENTVGGMFAAVCTLFDHLGRLGLRQASTMPMVISPPEDI